MSAGWAAASGWRTGWEATDAAFNIYAIAIEAGADEPRSLAQELCLIMEGAYVTRHVTGNKNTVDIARRIANLAISSRCPDSPS